ncbi:MAG: NAD(P)/FAD-dependent oxidoreductase, partial [Hyphomicrobiaceae bacterium]|nr:NAD(P)/FAD-dependent oxidoreductase [Hyphomicrobiaceae bacterium]
MALDIAGVGTAPLAAATRWLEAFNAAAEKGDAAALAALFLPEGHWRDVLAFTWDIETMNGRSAIKARFAETLPKIKPGKLTLAAGRTPPREVTRAAMRCVEALIEFETSIGLCSGAIRLVEDPDGTPDMKAWIVMTTLDEIRGYEEKIERRRPGGEAFSRDFGGDNWLDLREKSQAYEAHDPTVLVIGAGQAGLSVAARLKMLEIDTLVIDRHERIGDNWRKRYHSLVLHNEVYVNHLPYMPFPPNCPVYIPKDKLASWFEAYAEALELNVWTGTELTTGSYDDAAGCWNVKLRKTDGTERTMRPRHVVFATGVSAIPVIPKLPGLDTFAGTLMHSGSYTEGRAWKGRTAIVLGTGNSAHDVAQDLEASGANVTMVQRSSTYIVSLSEAQKVYAMYDEGPPFEDCDVLAMATPFLFLVRAYKLSTAEMYKADKPLLDRLEKVGFKLDMGGEGETGFQMKYLQQGGGYYFNVGCSDLIADGKIKLMHYDQIERFVPEGVLLKDGTIAPADLIVAATGYKNQQDV